MTDDEEKKEETEGKTTEEDAAKKKADAEDNSDNGGESGKEVQGSDLDKAIEINKEKAKLLDREEAILKRKEKLAAITLVGGRTKAGEDDSENKEETPKEYRARIEKEMSEGKTEFGN